MRLINKMTRTAKLKIKNVFGVVPVGEIEEKIYIDKYNKYAKEHNDILKEERRLERNRKNRERKMGENIGNDFEEVYTILVNAPTNSKVSFVFHGQIVTEIFLNSRQRTHEVWWFLMMESDRSIFNFYGGGYIYISHPTTPKKTKKINQQFKDGSFNCLLSPIKDYCIDKMNNAQTKKTSQNYKYRLNKVNALNEKYFNSGISEENIHEVANELQIDINISLPFQNDFIQVKSQKKPLRTFNYKNTKLNHVDYDTLAYKDNIIILTQDELKKKFKSLQKSKEYFTYKRYNTNITEIQTLNETFKLPNDYRDAIFNFEKDNKLDECKLCDIKNPNVSKFIRQGTHLNGTINNEGYGKHLIYGEDYLHIDQNRSYVNYKTCKYYEGFLGKVTDFRKCDHIVDVGFYRIKNIDFNNNLKLKNYNNLLKIWNNFNVYPSCELKFLSDNGVSFDVFEGCWGSMIDFDFNDELINNKTEDGIRYYCKYVGSMMCEHLQHSFYIQGNNNFIQNITNEVKCDNISRYNNELKVMYNKNSNYHLSHIAGFITAYTRLNTLEQLMELEVDDIYRVACDGIYYKPKEIELKNCFRVEAKNIKNNAVWDSYISNDTDIDYLNGKYLEIGEYRENNFIECHIGCGGGGKTYNNLIDKGFVNICYYAPSYKLTRKKQQEFNLSHSSVTAKLTSPDPTVLKYENKFNSVLIIDEVSMMSNEDKLYIIDNFKNCKLIFCGDVGFQLPAFSKDKNEIITPFKLCGTIIEHNVNRRVKCKKLHDILINCRELMNKNLPINDYVYKNFKFIKRDEIVYNYKNDIILASSHIRKDYYTDKYKNLDKYYITKTDRVYGRGEIVLEKPNTKDCEIRHAFTVHSIQGETYTGKIFIDIHLLSSNEMIYTAISRAKYYEQLVFILS